MHHALRNMPAFRYLCFFRKLVLTKALSHLQNRLHAGWEVGCLQKYWKWEVFSLMYCASAGEWLSLFREVHCYYRLRAVFLLADGFGRLAFVPAGMALLHFWFLLSECLILAPQVPEQTHEWLYMCASTCCFQVNTESVSCLLSLRSELM